MKMFDGIKLLCTNKMCLNSVIVPENKFFKISLTEFRCHSCEHINKNIASFFKQIISVSKSRNELKKTGFLHSTYDLGFIIRFDENEETSETEHTRCFLENNDWHHWNLQISCVTLKNIKSKAIRFEIWEDHFAKANTFLNPAKLKLGPNFTFNKLLRAKTFFRHDTEVKNLYVLQNFLREIRKYNNAWLKLFQTFLTAAPVDLKHQVYTDLSNVKSLAGFYGDELYS